MRFFDIGSQYAPGERPYQIFQNRLKAVADITTAIRGRIKNRYYKQLNEVTMESLHRKISKDQEAEKLALYSGEPDESIYPPKDVMEKTVTQFVDYSMGTMMRKETTMGRLPAPGAQTGVPSGVIPTGTLPSVAPTLPSVAPTPSGEVQIPKINQQQLLDYVMSGGKMDWGSILKVMEERPQFMGGEYSPLEQTAIESVMGRDVVGEKTEGIKRASIISEYFKKPEELRVTSEIDMFMRYREKWTQLQEMKAKYKGETKTAWEIKVDTLMDWRDKDMISEEELKQGIGIGIKPEKRTQFEMEFDIMEQLNPSTDEWKKWLGAWVGEGTGDKVTTAEISLVEKQFTGVKTNEQYDKALATVRQTDKNVIVPTKEEQFMANYNKAKTAITRTAIDVDTGKIREGDYKAGLSYKDVYKALYEDLETAIREYQIATGQILDNPFLSFEEYEKSDIKPGKGLFYPSTWGQQQSVFEHSIGETKTIKDKTYRYKGGGIWEVL